ncbi:hypothetical protein LX32DRAFT_34901 [Colletotrichum zoysiae]|uniref:Uncharacterized protein n=1 Tax=Colletotrichum zoysiae TaxID=1216348 RepID=A0AAD9HBT6_9PEZI|nr:hypothetical protein LX32DRAFT_34901 [Colletotrichum zoysiae]
MPIRTKVQRLAPPINLHPPTRAMPSHWIVSFSANLGPFSSEQLAAQFRSLSSENPPSLPQPLPPQDRRGSQGPWHSPKPASGFQSRIETNIGRRLKPPTLRKLTNHASDSVLTLAVCRNAVISVVSINPWPVIHDPWSLLMTDPLGAKS